MFENIRDFGGKVVTAHIENPTGAIFADVAILTLLAVGALSIEANKSKDRFWKRQMELVDEIRDRIEGKK